MPNPAAAGAAILRYLAKERTEGHYERSDQLGGRSPEAYLREVVALRVAEVERWRQWWGDDVSPTPARVLDVGCGPGFVTLALARAYPGAEVLGIDVEPEGLEVAEALSEGNERLRFARRAAEEVDGGPYDLIVCRTVLEHVRDPRAALDRMVRALAPGGAAFIETPNYLYPREPHLALWMLPRSPKPLLRLQCRLTGRDSGFVDHLQLGVDSLSLPRWARAHGGVRVRNLAAEKVRRLLSGAEEAATPARRRAVTAASRHPALASALAGVAGWLPLSPSTQVLVVREGARAV